MQTLTLAELQDVIAHEPAGDTRVRSITVERIACIEEFIASDAPAALVSEDGHKADSVKQAYGKLIRDRKLGETLFVWVPKSDPTKVILRRKATPAA